MWLRVTKLYTSLSVCVCMYKSLCTPLPQVLWPRAVLSVFVICGFIIICMEVTAAWCDRLTQSQSIKCETISTVTSPVSVN